MIPEALIPAVSVLMRLLPIFIVAPIAPFKRAPILVRVVVLIALALLLSTKMDGSVLAAPQTSLTILLLSEFLIGASLAFSFHAAQAAMHTMGQLVDAQIGFSAAMLFDPSTQQAATPTAELLTMAVILVFLQFNVHYDLLIGFERLLHFIPVGAYPEWNSDWIKVIGTAYVLAFIIVSPIIFALWLIDLMLSFVSRSLPQAPIYFVALPIKVGIGIMILSWFFSHSLEALLRYLSNTLLSWEMMFRI